MSCGHLMIENRHNAKSRSWKGYGEISSTYFSQVKKGAKSRGLLFNISIEYLWELFRGQEEKCALTGISLIIPRSHYSSKKNPPGVAMASVDRIDSSKGYIVGNIQWVCAKINHMKWDLSQEEFIEMCYKVVNTHSR